MRKLIFSMMVSADGFIAADDDSLEWGDVDEELHRYVNDRIRDSGGSLYGRKVWDAMAGYWPTAQDDPSRPEVENDFARIWLETPKFVVSNNLADQEWNTTVIRDNVAGEIRKLKEQPGADVYAAGGELASTLLDNDLVDEVELYVHPVIIGSGKTVVRGLAGMAKLRLLEIHRFASGVVFLRYERVRDG